MLLRWCNISVLFAIGILKVNSVVYDTRTFFMPIPRVLVITRRTNNRPGTDEFPMKIGHSLWTNLGHNLCSNSELYKFNTNTGNPTKEKSYKSTVSYRFHCYKNTLKNKYFIPSCSYPGNTSFISYFRNVLYFTTDAPV